jgi:hypothetical protein
MQCRLIASNVLVLVAADVTDETSLTLARSLELTRERALVDSR